MPLARKIPGAPRGLTSYNHRVSLFLATQNPRRSFAISIYALAPPLRLAAPREHLLAPPPPHRHVAPRRALVERSLARSYVRSLTRSLAQRHGCAVVRESELPVDPARVDTMLENLHPLVTHVTLRGESIAAP